MKHITLWTMLCICITACQEPKRAEEFALLLGEGRLTATVNGVSWETAVGLTQEAKKDRYSANTNQHYGYRIETPVNEIYNGAPPVNCVFCILQASAREVNNYTLLFDSQLYGRFNSYNYNNISQDMTKVLVNYGNYYGYGGITDVYTVESGSTFNIIRFDDTMFEATFTCSLKHYTDASQNKTMTNGKISIKLKP